MAKRLNRLLAAIAAAATLATGVAGSAWADMADGKVDFDVKAADGTTLDGVDVGLYKVGGWNMDALERGGGKIVAHGSAQGLQENGDPRVRQFLDGIADGPVPFRYPAGEYQFDLLETGS